MTLPLDPFRAGPDVDAYIRREDFEQSCEYLTAKLIDGPTWVGISGPPGVGKTLLARLLLRRLARRFSVVHVPESNLSPREMERWIAAQLGAAAEPIAVLAAARARAGRPLLVAIDEAQRASSELVAWLESWCTGALCGRAVLVWTDAEDERAPAALARCPARVFVEPLGLAEVPTYVNAQLTRAGASPEQRAVLTGRTLDRIALASSGNPREIQRLADAELSAHAWRSRSEAVRSAGRPRSSERAVASAPRSAAPAAARLASPRHRRRSWLYPSVAAVALAALAAALVR